MLRSNRLNLKNKFIFKYFLFIFCASTISALANAQYSADLNSTIYKDIERWEGQGYIRQLPIFRPLPETVLVDIMRQVIKKGAFSDKQKAKRYFNKLTQLYFATDVYTFHYLNVSSKNSKKNNITWYGSAAVEQKFLSFFASPLVSISVGFGGKLVANKKTSSINEIRHLHASARYLNKTEEIPDSFELGRIQSIKLKGFTGIRTSFAVGKPNIFMQAGLMRRSIGPFFDDGIILSSRAPQTGNIFVHWRGKHLAATWGLFMLTSRQQYNKFDFPNDIKPSYRYKFNKAFFYNSLSWFINPNVEFNIFEAVVFGDVNLAYLLPIKIIYAIDGLSNFVAGNLFLGFSFDFRIAETVKIPIAMIIDDINVNDLVRFKFDTKIKVAAQTGVTWTARNSILKKLRFDYQIVLPYTYSHSRDGKTLYSTQFNTSNHTVQGEHLATSLKPSSHRIMLEAVISPIDVFELGFTMRFIQHNNPSAGILKGPKNDGGILDDGYYSQYYDDKDGPSFQNRNGFLSGVIEHTIEPSLSLGTRIPVFSNTSLYADASYTYRHIINNNFISGAVAMEHVLLFQVGANIATY